MSDVMTAFGLDEGSTVPPSLAAPTLAAAFKLTATEHCDEIAFPANDECSALTWADYAARVAEAAGALTALGMRRGDTAALMLSTRREFHWLDTALAHLGVAVTSLYNTAPVEQIRHVLEDSGASILLTEERFLPLLTPLASAGVIERLVVIDIDRSSSGLIGWRDAIARTAKDFDISVPLRHLHPDDVLCVMYTSGSTGTPRGVELTHRNVLSLLNGLQRRMNMPVGASQLSFLPMAHGMARVFDHYLQIALAFNVTTCPQPSDVGSLLPVVRPSFFASTPRLWEKLRAAVYAGLAAEPQLEKRDAMQSALQGSLARVHQRQLALAAGIDTGAAPPPPRDAKLLSEIAGLIGMDRIRAAVVGGAPVDAELLEFFHAIGVPLGEAYGLTECGAGAAANPAGRVKCGTVGPPLFGVTVKLASDGEILIKGPGVMKGYRGRPDATRAAFTADGWLLSGDVGSLDDDGYLRIVDRKKELIINSAGKNMSPAQIETALKHACPLIGQAVAIGDRRPYVVALIVPEAEALASLARRHGILPDDLAALARHPAVLAEIDAGVVEANRHLARVEQVKHYEVLTSVWELGSDELTPTAKLRRRVVAEKYRAQIDRLYTEADARYRERAPITTTGGAQL